MKTKKAKFTGRKINADGIMYEITVPIPDNVNCDDGGEYVPGGLQEFLYEDYEHISGLKIVEDFRPLDKSDLDENDAELMDELCQFFGFDRIVRNESGRWSGNHPNIIGMMLSIAGDDEILCTLYNRG